MMMITTITMSIWTERCTISGQLWTPHPLSEYASQMPKLIKGLRRSRIRTEKVTLESRPATYILVNGPVQSGVLSCGEFALVHCGSVMNIRNSIKGKHSFFVPISPLFKD